MLKKFFYSIVSVVYIVSALYAGDTIVRLGSVAVTTHTPILVLGYKPSRKMSSCYNDDATYAVYITTYLPTDLAELQAKRNYMPINAESSSRDDFFVYNSSWYATASSEAITGRLFYMEKE